MQSQQVTLDASPFLSFAKLFQRCLEGVNSPAGLGYDGFQLWRADADAGSTAANETVIRLYPSDAFLRFASAMFASEINLDTIN